VVKKPMIQNRLMTRFLNWEYWPWELVYFPIMIYWLWLSVKAKSFFFFFGANPGIESGGLLLESKNDILKLIPDNYKPKTIFCRYPVSSGDVTELMNEKNIHFPVIAKPDHGERGWMVEKIEGTGDLEKYINTIRINFLIQEYIDFPNEAGIFYYRFPGESQGHVSSVVIKELLKITGDGISTVRELVQKSKRAFLQLLALEQRIPEHMNYIPTEGEVVELVPIGNHSRGTKFLNGNHLINATMEVVFNRIALQINGFYYGRFDIRYKSAEDLYSGENIKILELNGAKSEPAHIYHPGYPICQAYHDLFYHWHTLYLIAEKNKKSGIPYPSFKEGISAWKKFRSFRQLRNR
jgi:hypothetical protein